MASEHFDVLIIGAGLSGIGAAYRLQTECPGKTYAVLEGRQDLGGTWDLFRYPGVRSDSDMFTLGYPFRPWDDAKAIADGPSILRYVRQTSQAYGIDRHIRYSQKVEHASWSSDTSTWTVTGHGPDGEPLTYTCRFLYLCCGYYSYEGGYMPEFPDLERFAGPVIHPQQWPEDLDYRDQRVVVIGSGATAVTLVPAMAAEARHVTMLQRSPTYITSVPGIDPLAEALRAHLPHRMAHGVIRWKNVLMMTAFYQLCRRAPALARRLLLHGVARMLPPGTDLSKDFTPSYAPWDQRLCFVPDGDLFAALSSGRADVVTDRITGFTEHGIDLASGAHLDADIVVSATGLQLVALGGISLEVDGEPVDPGQCFAYKGFMLSGVPNLAMCVGYTNASWTLRADLSSRAVCRLLAHMDAHRYTRAVPTPEGPVGPPRPILDLTSGYIQRGADVMPKQGGRRPWSVRQNYVLDALSAKLGDLTESITFGRGIGGPDLGPGPARATHPVATGPTS